MKNNDLISIIVPVYKVEKYLNRCIESLVNQTYRNIEIILINDGSPDRCPELCDEWRQRDSRVVVIHKENGGLSDARNAGIRVATGKYIMFVDSDDYIDLDSCNAFSQIAEKTGADIIVGEAVQETSSGNIKMKRTNLQEGKIYSNTEFIKLAIQAKEWYAPAWFSLYRRNMYKENHLEYIKGLLHEDMEMLPRVFFAAKTVSYLNKKFYHYVNREGSITSTEKKEVNGRDIIKIYTEWKKQFDRVDDAELQRLLYGFLVKCYLHSVRELQMTNGIEIAGVTKGFIIKYGLDTKEKIKALLFAISPSVFAHL